MGIRKYFLTAMCVAVMVTMTALSADAAGHPGKILDMTYAYD